MTGTQKSVSLKMRILTYSDAPAPEKWGAITSDVKPSNGGNKTKSLDVKLSEPIDHGLARRRTGFCRQDAGVVA